MQAQVPHHDVGHDIREWREKVPHQEGGGFRGCMPPTSSRPMRRWVTEVVLDGTSRVHSTRTVSTTMRPSSTAAFRPSDTNARPPWRRPACWTSDSQVSADTAPDHEAGG